MDTDVTRKRCSFCGKQGKPGSRFAGGLGAMMCEECVEHYHGVFSSPPKAQTAAQAPWSSMTDAELLTNIPLILQTAEDVDDFLVEWIELLRSRKISWAEIGNAMGVSRQSVWERFAQRVENLRASSSA